MVHRLQNDIDDAGVVLSKQRQHLAKRAHFQKHYTNKQLLVKQCLNIGAVIQVNITCKRSKGDSNLAKVIDSQIK